MLFKLSLENQRKSLKDYSIYFITLILGVCIFYIFNAINAQTVMMEVSQTKSRVIDTMNTALSVMSVVVSFILGFLIVYASRFLMKKRKWEFGIYMTLGMRKKDISGILLLETLIIGFISLIVGLLAGICLSQFMSLFVANMFRANMDRFVFVVSKDAIVKTILYYVLIYVIVLMMNTIVIQKAELIDLMSAHQKKERAGLKSLPVCLIIFIFACVLLGYAYYQVTAGAENLVSEFDVLVQLILGIVGTFLVFWSVSGLIVNLLKKIPGIYHKHLNSFVVGEVSHQMNTTVAAGSIICLLLFSTICILSSAFTLKSYKDAVVNALAPISASVSKDMESAGGEDPVSIEEIFYQQNVDRSQFREMVNVYTYLCDDVTHKTVLGTTGEELLSQDSSFSSFLKERIPIIKESDYNQVAAMYGKDQLDLGSDGYAIVADYDSMVQFFNKGLETGNVELNVKGTVLHEQYGTCKDGFLMMSYSKQNMGVVVVPDCIHFLEEERVKNYCLINYANDREEEKVKELEESGEWAELVASWNQKWEGLVISTRSDIYDDSIASSGMVVFVALYLGIVFMISSSAILALKEMSDAIDSRNKYAVLRKIGTSERQINRALFQKMSLFFGFPLLLAVIHSVFGIQVCNTMLSIYDSSSILRSLVTAAVIIVAIYGGYFSISYLCCKRLIK